MTTTKKLPPIAKKQPPKTRPFSNLNKVDLVVGGIEGTVTIPLILDDLDLAKYIEYMDTQKGDITEDAQEKEVDLLQQIRARHESRRHMVKAIAFPGVTMSNYQPDGKQPFPALVFAVGEALDSVVRDALNLPN